MDWDIEIINECNEDLSMYEKLIKTAFVAAVAVSSLAAGEVCILLVRDDEMQAINLENRGKDATTDVLAFPQYQPNETFPQDFCVLGDIVISIDKARAQAAEYGHSFERELTFLTIHAALHLLGHDHDTKDAESEMFALQKQILGGINV